MDRWYQDDYLPDAMASGSPVALWLGFTPRPLLADAPGNVPRTEGAGRRFLHLVFLDEEPSGMWADRFAGHGAELEKSGLASFHWATPFISRLSAPTSTPISSRSPTMTRLSGRRGDSLRRQPSLCLQLRHGRPRRPDRRPVQHRRHRQVRRSTQPPSEWDKILAVNLIGTFVMCQAVLPYLLEQGSGAVLNTASTAGVMGQPFSSCSQR